jgi:hypothetical protein
MSLLPNFACTGSGPENLMTLQKVSLEVDVNSLNFISKKVEQERAK